MFHAKTAPTATRLYGVAVRMLCKRIDENTERNWKETEGGLLSENVEVHLAGAPSTCATTACGIVDPVGWDVEETDDLPTCKKCLDAVKFYRNLRLIDGSIPFSA